MGMFISAEVQSSKEVINRIFEKIEKMSDEDDEVFSEIEFQKLNTHELHLSESSMYGLGGGLTFFVSEIVEEVSKEFPFVAVVLNTYDDGAGILATDENEGLGWTRIIVNGDVFAGQDFGFGNFSERILWNIEEDGTVGERGNVTISSEQVTNEVETVNNESDDENDFPF